MENTVVNSALLTKNAFFAKAGTSKGNEEGFSGRKFTSYLYPELIFR